jgi:anaerobic magnesium-protoporphyrin IX monomethyl ester cyclase
MRYHTTPNPYAVRGLMLSSFYILIGQACASNCTFCVAKRLRKSVSSGKYVRFRSAKNVVKEPQILVKNYSIDSFYIIDDTFTLEINHASEFCDELLAKKLDLIWGCEAKIKNITEDLLKMMRKTDMLK